jgi:hypothetical protein
MQKNEIPVLKNGINKLEQSNKAIKQSKKHGKYYEQILVRSCSTNWRIGHLA